MMKAKKSPLNAYRDEAFARPHVPDSTDHFTGVDSPARNFRTLIEKSLSPPQPLERKWPAGWRVLFAVCAAAALWLLIIAGISVVF